MKIILNIGLLSLALALTGCGSDSDSSGSTHVTTPSTTPSTAPTPVTPPPATNVPECVVVNNSVQVPATTGCTYSTANVNHGAIVTYTCNGTTVSNSLGITSGNFIDMNGIIFSCK